MKQKSEPPRLESGAAQDGVNFADVLGTASHTALGANQALAREALEKLREMKDLASGFNEMTSLISQIIGGVRQVAEGHTDRVRYEVAERITTLQRIVGETRSKWAYLTAYSDVVKVRNQLQKLSEGFPMLDRISEELVDYRREGGGD